MALCRDEGCLFIFKIMGQQSMLILSPRSSWLRKICSASRRSAGRRDGAHARTPRIMEHGLDIRSSWDVITVAMMRGANRAHARSPKALRLITQPAEAWTPAKFVTRV